MCTFLIMFEHFCDPLLSIMHMMREFSVACSGQDNTTLLLSLDILTVVSPHR